jgi:hypothetical protein
VIARMLILTKSAHGAWQTTSSDTIPLDSIFVRLMPRYAFPVVTMNDPPPPPSWWHLHSSQIALALFAAFLLVVLLRERKMARESIAMPGDMPSGWSPTKAGPGEP